MDFPGVFDTGTLNLVFRNKRARFLSVVRLH